MLELVRTHGVSLPGHISATVVATLVLEGWSNELDPSHTVLNEVKRVVAARQGGWRGLAAQVAALGLGSDLILHPPVELEAEAGDEEGLMALLHGHLPRRGGGGVCSLARGRCAAGGPRRVHPAGLPERPDGFAGGRGGGRSGGR